MLARMPAELTGSADPPEALEASKLMVAEPVRIGPDSPGHGQRFELERCNSPRWSGQQRRIGLTGGIATGKSSVGRLLAAQGLPVLDADQFAREALAPDSPGARAVLARYGDAVRQPSSDGDGARHAAQDVIDRASLGRIVFADGAERCWLEQLVHPLVRQRFTQALERLDGESSVVLMIPLLFEAGLESLCSEVWLVDCDPQQQLQRLMARDGLSAEEAQSRIDAQWPLERKRALVDHIIDNRGDAGSLEPQLRSALNRPGGSL